MGRVGEASILSAVEKLEDNLARVRNEGIEDLRRIFTDGGGSSRIEALSDDVFHKILEILFRIIRAEKPNYVRASKPTPKATAAGRLSLAATALRLVVEIAVPRLKHKTAWAVLDHIIDTLPVSDQGFCAPLETDYLKVFRIILEHPSHAEHLRAKQWQAYVDFMLEGITSSLGDRADDEAISLSRSTSMTSRTNRSMSIRPSQSGFGSTTRSQVNTHADEMMNVLRCLTSITHAPLMTRIKDIAEAMIAWIGTSQRTHDVALGVLNNLLPPALSEDVAFAATIFDQAATSIRRLWTTKSIVVKEQILITLYYSRHLYTNTTWEPQLVNIATLDLLIDTIWSDAERRIDRDVLQLDDVSFIVTHEPSAFSIIGIQPIPDSTRVTPIWLTLSVLASLIVGRERRRQTADRNDEPDTPRKRRKLENFIDQVIIRASSSTGQPRVVALQLALFIVDQLNELPESLRDNLTRMETCFTDDDSTAASWLFVLLARISLLPNAHSDALRDFWPRVWMSASRALGIAAQTRAACHFMGQMVSTRAVGTILTSQVVTEAIFSDANNGPGIFTDAAIILLTKILNLGLIDNEKRLRQFCSRSLSWLSSQWNIPSVPDRLHNAQLASYGQPCVLYSFLAALTGSSSSTVKPRMLRSIGPLDHASAVDRQDLQFASYLLGDEKPQSHISRDKDCTSSTLAHLPASSHLPASGIMDMLLSKTKAFHGAWKGLSDERIANINPDIVDMITTVCVLSMTFLGAIDQDQHTNLSVHSIMALWQDVCDFCAQKSDESSQALLARTGLRLIQLEGEDYKSMQRLSSSRVKLVDGLLDTIERDYQHPTTSEKTTIDLMDSIDTRTSQGSQARSNRTHTEFVRQDLPLPIDDQTSFMQMKLSLKLESLGNRVLNLVNIDYMQGAVDEFVSLDAEDLLSCRAVIIRTLEQDLIVKRADACRLIERLAEVCLRDDQFERCEAALCFCLRVMTRLAVLWTSDSDDALGDRAYDIYAWYLNVALNKGLASKRVQVEMSSLLEAVLRHNPSYSTDSSLLSPRTALLQILKNGQNALKFSITERLSRLFDGYILSEHTAIFNDIVDSLPADLDNREGIVVRLFSLATLGARWHTILRQAVYHIFETTANAPLSTAAARTCLVMMCERLELGHPRDLLRLFSSQILYTWLEEGSIDMIPSNAFGYATLAECVRDLQDEIVAQTAMRASLEHVQKVVHHLGASWDALVERSFAKAAAYAIIADNSNKRGSGGFGKAERFLLEHLGEARYLTLCHDRFPETFATVMVRLTDDTGFEKAFGGHRSFGTAATTFAKICRHSSSNLQLPPGQQPSFRVKHLPHILERLCAHAQLEDDQPWTSAVVISACRWLLDDAKPAFGPLHACAMLRKLRVLVCIADGICIAGYPLQMLLHNLRPFLTQFHCSEDAIGLFWYLLEQGKSRLGSHAPFVTGLGVSTFTSLSQFRASSQESTTQESHYMSTMSKAQSFQKWLGQYLSTFNTAALSSVDAEKFANIITHASGISGSGSSMKTTAEGSLLYQLLVDQISDKPLLSKTFFDLTIKSLCRDFTPVTDPQDDILSEDQDAIKLAPVIWSIVRDHDVQNRLRVWGAQALGRAYALNGPDINTKAYPGDGHSVKSDVDKGIHHSYNSIISALINCLWGDQRVAASAAEQTLQIIFSSISLNDRLTVLGNTLDTSLFDDLRFQDYECPNSESRSDSVEKDASLTTSSRDHHCKTWASQIAVDLCRKHSEDPVLSALGSLLQAMPRLAANMLCSIVHIVLLIEYSGHQETRESLSSLFMDVLNDHESLLQQHAMLILEIILYLRYCTVPSESAMAQRNTWLEIDFQAAAAAATKCNSFNIALLLLEVHASQLALSSSRSYRRSTQTTFPISQPLLTNIYRHVDDPDFFYGTPQEADINAIVKKLCHEGAGHKALSFQSALFDSDLRANGADSVSQHLSLATVEALSSADFQGLALSLGRLSLDRNTNLPAHENLRSTMNLHQWDVGHTGPQSKSAPVATAFRALGSANDKSTIVDVADKGILILINSMFETIQPSSIWQYCSSLTILAEMKEAMLISTYEDLESLTDQRCAIQGWTRQASFESVEQILLGREALFGTLKHNQHVQNALGLSFKQILLLEVKTLQASLATGRAHDAAQFCLNRAAYMSDLISSAERVNLRVSAAIRYDLANTLWTQNETSASIKILQDINSQGSLKDQAIEISLPEVLTDLGQKLTEARLDRPDEVTSQYLQPAIEALGKQVTGSRAGRVYHNFAAFCDQQLRDPDNLDEFARIEKLRNRKKQEVDELEAMKKVKEGKERDQVRSHLMKAQTWFKLDEQEWRRLKKYREQLIEDCLENYLRAMGACEDFPNDVLRFLALWLEQSGNAGANVTVSKHLPMVPSFKFASLMNQLSSRISSTSDAFQRLLFELMYRICNDHPYHSLNQVFATSKSKGQKSDTMATSRHTAATKLAETIMKKGAASAIWISVHNSNIAFVRIATDKVNEKEIKTGAKVQLRRLQTGAKLEQTIHALNPQIPPPAMNISLRADKNYSSTPTLVSFEQSITIAGGVSAPKILTAVASDGSKHKMLLKGGNDDLRQDSIMEQVFGQVSNLLRDHRAARQRKLGIRTYKVIPLTTNAGIIEFVKGTMPLHDYVLPAHTRYFPKDFKPNRCRKEISDAQSKSLDHRLKAYRNVVDNFHPVMRFFFMEHFLDPDEWFNKRLNYSRSTAAISMLGHVLGLGDRHGHNILLDTNTGEVVHIDLGVAFEAGRVLPVPEVVPFRMTRDLVDGMGLSGVEGVFRRCCNFTLEALRQDQEAIMTILDVLRWDPLYSWSISPLRLQRMQENQELAANRESTPDSAKDAGIPDGGGLRAAVATNDLNEPGEADRALAIVAKKLGKSLSVEATVNDLIRQATDERNLAVLYCGWAAYA